MFKIIDKATGETISGNYANYFVAFDECEILSVKYGIALQVVEV
jgi:hypothetical protein